MKKNLLWALCLLYSSFLGAQNIFGTVVNENEERLFGATVQWEYSSTGTVADEFGEFVLPKKDTAAYLVINYVGYETVYIPVEPHEDTLLITINGINDLMEIEVAAKIRDNYISTLSPINLETIGSGELRKAACCNLAESFGTNASVDVSYSDAITGAREIQMLGLRGSYTQMMIEKRPAMTGLGSAFALEYLPGTWLHSIQISKGASTVQNGYQGIAGQINSELLKPFEDKPFFINLYGSTFGRGEVNVHLNKKLTDKWSAGLLLHGSARHNELDGNNDSFYDTPQKDMLDGMFRLFYRGDVLRGQFNVHALTDKHTAGQIIPDNANNPNDYFGIGQQNDRIEFFAKTGFLGFQNPNTSLAIITNASWHQLDANYGKRLHQGKQQNFYSNLLYATALKNDEHKINLGASYLYDNYEEQFDDSDYNRTEKVPGIFAEYNFAPVKEHVEAENAWENFGVLAGLRVDRHNLFGWLVTPRLNLKYNFTDETIVRLSAGRGYRTANVIAENISLLASSRSIQVLESLKMEDAWNFGFNFAHNFDLFQKTSSFTLDLYRTQFNNQVVIDRESDFSKVLFYNLDGKSFANSLLTVFSHELTEGFDIKLAYKYNDVKINYLDGLREKPLVAKHRGLVTLGYETKSKNWMFNSNLQIVGKQRFPNNDQFPQELVQDHTGYSPAYVLLGGQVTYTFKQFEIYAGGENLTNYTAKNPIIDWENPFGEYFDATQVYAPITGAMAYLGVRFSIE